MSVKSTKSGADRVLAMTQSILRSSNIVWFLCDCWAFCLYMFLQVIASDKIGCCIFAMCWIADRKLLNLAHHLLSSLTVYTCLLHVHGWTENAGPENGGPKKIKYLKIQDQKMRDHRNMTGNWRTNRNAITQCNVLSAIPGAIAWLWRTMLACVIYSLFTFEKN